MDRSVIKLRSALRERGLVRTARDKEDGRKSQISITARGQKLFDAVAENRNAWLVDAIESQIPARDRAKLAKAIELLERLATAGTAGDA